MEKIEKQIKLITTTGRTGNGDVVIVPDQTVSYNLKILLTNKVKDWGYFDAIELNADDNS